MVRNSDAHVPFTIRVVDSDDVNAFALPGGFFYVNSGLILAADDEAELAGVMAHEIGHVAACHAAEENFPTREHPLQIGRQRPNPGGHDRLEERHHRAVVPTKSPPRPNSKTLKSEDLTLFGLPIRLQNSRK